MSSEWMIGHAFDDDDVDRAIEAGLATLDCGELLDDGKPRNLSFIRIDGPVDFRAFMRAALESLRDVGS